MGLLRKIVREVTRPLGPVGKPIRQVANAVLDVGSAVVNPVGKPLEKAVRKVFGQKKRQTVTVIASMDAVIVKPSDLARATVAESSFPAVRLSLAGGIAAAAAELGRVVPRLAGEAATSLCTSMKDDLACTEIVMQVDIQLSSGELMCGAVVSIRDGPPSPNFSVQGTLVQCTVAIPPLRDTAGRVRGLTSDDALVITAHLEAEMRAHVRANPATCSLITL
jgi:hypothetical protein